MNPVTKVDTGLKQLLADADPVVCVSRPFGHAIHVVATEALMTLEYVEMGHSVHAVAPGKEYVPAAQRLQACTPVVALKDPPGHALQRNLASYVPGPHAYTGADDGWDDGSGAGCRVGCFVGYEDGCREG